MHLIKPFSTLVRYYNESEKPSYSELLEELNIKDKSEDSDVYREVTIFTIDSIYPYRVDDDSCYIKTYTDSFICKKSYQEIKKELSEYLTIK
jgi:hypothetical protein